MCVGICRDCRTAIVPDTKITVTEACSSSIAGIAKGIEMFLWWATLVTVRSSFSSFHMYFRGERALSIAILRKFVIKHDLFSDRHPLV